MNTFLLYSKNLLWTTILCGICSLSSSSRHYIVLAINSDIFHDNLIKEMLKFYLASCILYKHVPPLHGIHQCTNR